MVDLKERGALASFIPNCRLPSTRHVHQSFSFIIFLFLSLRFSLGARRQLVDHRCVCVTFQTGRKEDEEEKK